MKPSRSFISHVKTGEARTIAALAGPIALTALLNMGMSITDTVMVSQLGGSALAAVAVGSDFYSIVFYLAVGVIGGLSPFLSAAIARQDETALARLWWVGWLLVMAAALLLAPLVFLGPDFLPVLGLDPVLIEEGRYYTYAMAVNIMPMLTVALLKTVLTSHQRPKISLWITIAALPLNALLNAVLIHGIGGYLEYGITGAGISSCLVSTFVAICHMAAIQRHALLPRPQAFACRGILTDFIAVCRVGLPIGVATVGELGIFLGATLFVATMGAAEVAAHTVAIRLAGLAYALPLALSQSASVRMAHMDAQYGTEGRRIVISTTLTLSAATGLVLALAVVLNTTPLTALFFDASPLGQTAAEVAMILLLLLAVMELVETAASATAGLLRGRKDTQVPMAHTMIGYWGIAAPLGLYLAVFQELNAVGVWIALTVGTFATAGLNIARLTRHWAEHESGEAGTYAQPCLGIIGARLKQE